MCLTRKKRIKHLKIYVKKKWHQYFWFILFNRNPLTLGTGLIFLEIPIYLGILS